jgi:hypothetical protein
MVASTNQPTQNPAINQSPPKFAMSQMAGNAQKQAELNQKYAGGAATPAPNTVPMVASRYQSYSGAGQDTGATQKNNYVVSQQSGANAKYDNLAYQKGGKRRKMRRIRVRTRKCRRSRRRARAMATRRRSRTMRRY